MADVAQQIRLARKRLRMNQAQFAEALGASQGSVSKWESGREVPRLETIQKLSELVEGFVIKSDQTPVLHRKTERVTLAATATVMGAVKDGNPPYRYEPTEITAIVSEGWEEHTLEAWYFMNYHDWDPERKPTLGIFARLREDDRIDDLERGDRFLLEVKESEETKLCIVALEGARPGAMSLWPTSREGRQFMQSIMLTASGRPPSTNVSVRGILIGTYTFMAFTEPENMEQYEF